MPESPKAQDASAKEPEQ
jgi:hypothetical protein